MPLADPNKDSERIRFYVYRAYIHALLGDTVTKVRSDVTRCPASKNGADGSIKVEKKTLRRKHEVAS